MTADKLLAQLDDEQQQAVLAPSGPVCIIAGAGTGKTRTVTHRIAYRVAIGAIRADSVLAVTHSTRAAGELRERLGHLGVAGVNARTFHSAALRQLRHFYPRTGRSDELQLLDNKYGLVRAVLERRPGRTSAETAEVLDFTGEVQWAKARLLTPAQYPAAARAAARALPASAEACAEVYAAYEKLRERRGLLDFEDLLALTAQLVESDAEVAAAVHAQYSAFTVDEFQDVDPLQARLLAAWLGDRDDVTIVGDPRQTVFSFKGADPSFLQDFPARYPTAAVVTLHRDYRSTQQVVDTANRLAGASGPAALTGIAGDGPEPAISHHYTEADEAKHVASLAASAIGRGTPAQEIAVLYRFNSHAVAFEQALAERGVPYVLADTETFFKRPEVLAACRGLAAAVPDASEGEPGLALLRQVLADQGFDRETPPSGAGAMRERWEALLALLELCERMPGAETLDAQFLLDELRRRAGDEHGPQRQAVALMTLHKAKGLEWDMVILPRLTDGAVPSSFATTPDQVEEERRLLYVGITRARRSLHLTWARTRDGKRPNTRSPFLDILDPAGAVPRKQTASERADYGRCETCRAELHNAVAGKLRRCYAHLDDPVRGRFERLRRWRAEKARESGGPAFTILADATLLSLAVEAPRGPKSLVKVPGIGTVKRDRWGKELIALVRD